MLILHFSISSFIVLLVVSHTNRNLCKELFSFRILNVRFNNYCINQELVLIKVTNFLHIIYRLNLNKNTMFYKLESVSAIR
jgi:hypothetical protein